MEERIRGVVARASAGLGGKADVIAIRRPPKVEWGDYAVYVGEEVQEAVIAALREELKADALKVEKAGGFINITLSHEYVTRMLDHIVEQKAAWGTHDTYQEKRIMVEYTDPNPFKEMHIGHLMSNVIGESIARLFESGGAHMVRACYQGDVGPHVAKALWGLMDMGVTEPTDAAQLGKAYAHGSSAYEQSEKAKAEIDALNVAIYKGEERDLMELWRKGRDVSLAAFEEIYRALGTKFDYYFFESEVSALGSEQVRKHTPSVFTESDGAVIYEGEKKGLHTLVFITSKGTPTYEAKEIGLAFTKEERWPSDESYILTAAEQVGHFKVVKAALEDVAPVLGAKTHHIPHGFLRLTSGKMSSREGTVITAESLLEDVFKKATEKNEDPLIAKQVALAAIKYMILRQAPGGDIIFDPEKSLSLDGDSGPYLQYALVRARKIVAYQDTGAGGSDVPDAPYVLERALIRFEEVVARASRERAPQHITQYLTEIASLWNAFYASEQILGSPEEVYKQRMARAFLHTMENGLALLGIPAPERM